MPNLTSSIISFRNLSVQEESPVVGAIEEDYETRQVDMSLSRLQISNTYCKVLIILQDLILST
jgi:hypothetical protein